MTYNAAIQLLMNEKKVIKRSKSAWKLYLEEDYVVAVCAITNGKWRYVATSDDQMMRHYYKSKERKTPRKVKYYPTCSVEYYADEQGIIDYWKILNRSNGQKMAVVYDKTILDKLNLTF
jgi:hypothetical protein